MGKNKDELEIDLDEQSPADQSINEKSKSSKTNKSRKKDIKQDDKNNQNSSKSNGKSLISRIGDVEEGLELQRYTIKSYFANDDKNKEEIINNIKVMNKNIESLNDNICQIYYSINKILEENQNISEYMKQLTGTTKNIHEVQKEDVDDNYNN